jgi:hypothetical protein
MYAWVFWYAKKSLKSINDAPASYSYHNHSTLVVLKPGLWYNSRTTSYVGTLECVLLFTLF